MKSININISIIINININININHCFMFRLIFFSYSFFTCLVLAIYKQHDGSDSSAMSGQSNQQQGLNICMFYNIFILILCLNPTYII